jgi:phage shock protein A
MSDDAQLSALRYELDQLATTLNQCRLQLSRTLVKLADIRNRIEMLEDARSRGSRDEQLSSFT